MSPENYSFAFWTLTFLISYSTLVHGLPLDNFNSSLPANVKTYENPFKLKFAVEPTGRGTWGILISCTATFAFCVWTTVHPNILPDASIQYRTLYKAVMMVIGVINPEGLMILSYGQWADARRLNQEVQKYWNEKREVQNIENPELKKGYEKIHWDWLGMDGAFFVVMGGFVIDTSKCIYHDDARPETLRDVKCIKLNSRQYSKFNAVLTPTGFIKYLHDGYFDFYNPPFKKREIIDKGKASNIAKLLSAVQAFWLAVQCAGRRAAGLKLCLLEIHILIQVACTALIFWFW
ncbi:hypothetical protein BZA77DRAFT_248178, partial [Pyronema omphalodes]